MLPTPAEPPHRKRRGLFFRAAVLSTLLVIFSVGPCAYFFIRQQRAESWADLKSLLTKETSALANIAAAQNKGLRSGLTNYCRELFSDISLMDYVAVVPDTPTEPAEYHDQHRWTADLDRKRWTPGQEATPFHIWTGKGPTGRDVLQCRMEISVPGTPLGWVYVGVSLKRYEQMLTDGIRNTISTVVLAALLGIAGSFLMARRVTKPLEQISELSQRIADGDLSGRIQVQSTGEVLQLADNMNAMAARLDENARALNLKQRELERANASLQERVINEQLLSLIASDFLHAEHSAADTVFTASMEKIAMRLNIDGASIFLHDNADHATLERVWEWHRPEAAHCSLERVPVAGFPWATALANSRTVITISDSTSLPEEARAEQVNLERLGIRSAASAILGAGEKAAGYLFLHLHEAPRTWTPEEEQFILIASAIFSNAIARREAALERERLQAQLLQSQKMEAVGKLSGGIAHDFNNMLVPIVGYSDSILSSAPENAPWINEIREIKRSAESAASLTRQLLSFSRKQITSRKELDLNGLIQTLQNMLRRVIGENINLQTDLAPDLWTIAADAGQIEQVLMNLTVNAKAAMPNGGTIRIQTEMVDSEDASFNSPPNRKLQGLFIRLSVCDCGCGMDKATLDRIFEPFFSTKGEEGTGLGLSVVYGVMEEHGGWVTVNSAPGKGTTFHLWIPALHEPVPQPMDTGLAVAPPLPRGHGQRILIIEDEPGVLAFVSAALRQHGYNILTANCGSAARQVFEDKGDEIDLVMSDVVLPDTTGVQLLEEFFTTRPDLRALLTSGYSEKQSLVDLVKKRGLFFLHKPYTLIQLLESVHNAISAVKPQVEVT
jgi:signal transduction histidine kinase/ActR/RegA family two-component response regulator